MKRRIRDRYGVAAYMCPFTAVKMQSLGDCEQRRVSFSAMMYGYSPYHWKGTESGAGGQILGGRSTGKTSSLLTATLLQAGYSAGARMFSLAGPSKWQGMSLKTNFPTQHWYRSGEENIEVYFTAMKLFPSDPAAAIKLSDSMFGHPMVATITEAALRDIDSVVRRSAVSVDQLQHLSDWMNSVRALAKTLVIERGVGEFRFPGPMDREETETPFLDSLEELVPFVHEDWLQLSDEMLLAWVETALEIIYCEPVLGDGDDGMVFIAGEVVVNSPAKLLGRIVREDIEAGMTPELSLAMRMQR